MRICALLTCHNRRATTLACLESLHRTWPDDVDLEVILVDDGSTDGTGEAVRSGFPAVRVIDGPGDLFWCRGMHRAWNEALEIDADADLWLNDDVVLTEDALARILRLHRERERDGRPAAVLVGTMVDPDTGVATYGGHRATSSWHPGRFDALGVTDAPTLVDTFNGNVVLVPRAVSDQIGIIDPAYSHATGDTDYGLRATRAGIEVLVVPGVMGVCARNPPVRHTFRTYIGRKGLPWRDWLRFTRTFTPYRLWPVTFVSPYVRFVFHRLTSRPVS